jgi:hypothetical protein
MQNFLGKDNFIWWIGVIENRMDPLGLGRCQVRIFGWHDDGSPEAIAKIPLSELPWALPLQPLNSSRTFASPFVGDWVMGFFMDGMSGQFPIMMGVLPGYGAENPFNSNAIKK